MDRPVISVIVPTFNAAPTLARCLDSIAEQTYGDIEVLIIDGGSTDGTSSVALAYMATIARLRYVAAPDKGIYDAMNKGVALATGKWLYFIGSDDALFSKDVFHELAQNFDDDIDFLYGDAFRMDMQHVRGGAFTDAQLWAYNICHQAILYRRSLIDAMGPFDLAYAVYADWHLNIRCFAMPCRRKYVKVTVCTYAGAGFSAVTLDRLFLKRKFAEIAKAYRRSLWSSLFRPARHQLLAQAQWLRSDGDWLAACQFLVLFVFHALASKAAGIAEKAVRAFR